MGDYISTNNYKSFIVEIQNYYKISFSQYQTKYYAEVGMDFELVMDRTV